MSKNLNPDHNKSDVMEDDQLIRIFNGTLDKHHPSKVNILELFESYYQMLKTKFNMDIDLQQRLTAMVTYNPNKMQNYDAHMPVWPYEFRNIRIRINLAEQPYFILHNGAERYLGRPNPFYDACKLFLEIHNNEFQMLKVRNKLIPCRSEEDFLKFVHEGYAVAFVLHFEKQGAAMLGNCFRNPSSLRFSDAPMEDLNERISVRGSIGRISSIELLITPHWGNDRE